MHTMAAVAVLMAALGGNPDGVVLNFTASWCGPCQQMAPIVSRLQQQGYAIQKIDGDARPDLVRQFRVDGYPTFVLVVRGEERGRRSGSMSEADLRRMAGSIPEKATTRPAVAETKSVPAKLEEKPRWGWSKPLETASKPTSASNSKTMLASRSGGAAIKSGTDNNAIIRANISEAVSTGFAKDPMQVSVRLKATDAKGHDWGSGTVIFSEPNQALILTCGHIFRHFDNNSRIEVDLFDGSDYQRLIGEVVTFDLKSDIGLVKVAVPKILPVARIATQPAKETDHVFSVGCGGGEAPSKLQHRVTKTTGYVQDILECTGVPVPGRSGGGLFSSTGEVVGVCILADPNGRRGLYTGLKTIHQLMARSGIRQFGVQLPEVDLAHSATEDGDRAPDLPETFDPNAASRSGAADAAPDFDDVATSPRSLPVELLSKSATASKGNSEARVPVVAGPSAESLRETLDATKGAEVVCIIRDPAKPDSASRVVIIHRASERFVTDLTGELEQQVQTTSLPIRKTQSAPAKSESKSVNKIDPESQRYRRSR